MDRDKSIHPRHRLRAFAVASTLLAAMVLQAACTVVSIHDSEGTTRIERNLGVVHITLSPAVSATVSEIRSFGFVSGPLGVQAGLISHKIAATSDSCRLIVWIETAEQLDFQLWQQIEHAKNVCVVDPRETRHASD